MDPLSGLVRHRPDPPLPGVHSDKVDAAGQAYHFLHTPDGALGLASYGVSMALIGMGDGDRAVERPIVPLLATAKLAADALSAVWLTVEPIPKHRARCGYCLAAAAASVAAAPTALPEARAAWRSLRG